MPIEKVFEELGRMHLELIQLRGQLSEANMKVKELQDQLQKSSKPSEI